MKRKVLSVVLSLTVAAVMLSALTVSSFATCTGFITVKSANAKAGTVSKETCQWSAWKFGNNGDVKCKITNQKKGSTLVLSYRNRVYGKPCNVEKYVAASKSGYAFSKWTYTDKNGKVTAIKNGDRIKACTIIGRITINANFKAAVVPIELIKAKCYKKSIGLSWNRVPGAAKYIVYGNICGKNEKQLKVLDGLIDERSCVIKKIDGKKLKVHKAYKFHVVADTPNGLVKSRTIHVINGVTQDKYANVKSITAKYSEVLLAAGDSKTIGATYKMYYGKKHLSKLHGKALRYVSNCPNVAKVNSNGVVKAVSKGTATIYIQDVGGLFCKTVVKVNAPAR